MIRKIFRMGATFLCCVVYSKLLVPLRDQSTGEPTVPSMVGSNQKNPVPNLNQESTRGLLSRPLLLEHRDTARDPARRTRPQPRRRAPQWQERPASPPALIQPSSNPHPTLIQPASRSSAPSCHSCPAPLQRAERLEPLSVSSLPLQSCAVAWRGGGERTCVRTCVRRGTP